MSLQEQIRANRIRTAIVLLGFVVLIAAFCAIVGYSYSPGLAGVVGIVGIGYGLISYFASGAMVAGVSNAHPVTRADAPELYHAVETVSLAAGLARTPPIYLIPDDAANAFAAGRTPDTAYIAATRGIIALLDRRELEGVVAHEISHIRNRDVRLMTIASVLVGVVALLSDMLMRMAWMSGNRRRGEGQNPLILIFGLVAIVLAPISASLLQMALSRRREFLADASAAELTGDPEGLARALAKLRDDHRPLQRVTRATAHLYIESPLRDHAALRSSLGGLFDTHPPLEDRIRALEESGGFQLA